MVINYTTNKREALARTIRDEVLGESDEHLVQELKGSQYLYLKYIFYFNNLSRNTLTTNFCL